MFHSSCVAGIVLGVLLGSCSLVTKEPKLATKRLDANNRSTSAEIPTVQFCEILKEPHRYDSSVIRIKGRLSRFRDYVTFYDSNCVPKHPLITVRFSPTLQYEHESEASRTLGQIIAGNQDAIEGDASVFVSVIGPFGIIPASERQPFTELQYRFTITEVEEITQETYAR